MENNTNLLDLLGQRRVWIAIISAVSIVISMLHLQYKIDVPVLSDLFTGFGVALVNLVTASLAIWSYLKPKSKT